MSTPGEQTAWAEASFEQRESIHKRYRDYTKQNPNWRETLKVLK